MLLIPCPYCGDRPEIEFSYGGQAHIARPLDPSALDDARWGDFLYSRDNIRGLHRERWRHSHGCGRFFNVVRDTRSDQIMTSYRVGEAMPELESA
jgi:sarcosine oxidase subunit delta